MSELQARQHVPTLTCCAGSGGFYVQYECLEKLGEGAFGEALKARRRKVHQPCQVRNLLLAESPPWLLVPWMQQMVSLPALLALDNVEIQLYCAVLYRCSHLCHGACSHALADTSGDCRTVPCLW